MNRIDTLPMEAIVEVCEEYRIRELSVFGSFLRSDFDADTSDIDFIADFIDELSYCHIADTKAALSAILGREADIVASQMVDTTRHNKLREEICDTCEIIYSEKPKQYI